MATSEDAPTALAIVTGFEPGAAAVVLEDEIRDAVLGTTYAALGAPKSDGLDLANAGLYQ